MPINAYITEKDFEIETVGGDILSSEEYSLLTLFQKDKFKFMFELVFVDCKDLSVSLTFLQSLSKTFVQSLVDCPEFNFATNPITIELADSSVEQILNNTPYMIGAEFVNSKWIYHILDEFNRAYKEIVVTNGESLANYFLQRNLPLVIPSRIYFYLVENKDSDKYPFAFLATYTVKQNNKIIHCPLNNALTELSNQREKLKELVYSIERAGEQSVLINGLIQSGNIFFPTKLNEKEAYTFLQEVNLYESCGIICRIPKWHTESKIQINCDDKQLFNIGYLSVGAINKYTPALIYRGVEITPDQARKLLSKSEGLELVKGRWIENHHAELQELLDEYETLSKDGTTLLELLKTKALSLKNRTTRVNIEINQSDWIAQLFRKEFDSFDVIQPTKRFSTILRPYQVNGFQWLYAMCKLGFGVCLADDMGLGKTIEILSLLDKLRDEKYGKILIIVPATLVENWRKEIDKFAPDFDCFVLRGQNEPLDDNVKAFITITTYQTAIKSNYIENVCWDAVILDEAQAIKNYYTASAQKVKSLQAKIRIAMTGTPIENNLLELWSIFDFINAGLLGTREEFTKYFLENSFLMKLESQLQFKRMISPFILRRVKTDKSIITDLPEKNEIDIIINLAKEQIVLYKKIVDELNNQIGHPGSKNEQKMLVISTIMKLKQVCNHPCQYYGTNDYLMEHSGKFIELKNICENIYAKREKVLVFTQFKEIIPALNNLLAATFHCEGYCIDGSTSMAKRNEYVEGFQKGDIPYMILSLKTAGVGLNLTAAKNIIHFDRWWNPAVENQATDRVYRIGQKKDVTVYKFISAGTIEEVINSAVSIKQSLADEYINELGTDVLKKLSINELLAAIKYGDFGNE